ncbi:MULTISPECIES: hypothetical protein [Winogradskyella]|uniref:hypothetical protein n=1 Tax=Winogradskyella TaxID=286104 RepID=UPI0015CE5F85|nr:MULTISPECIES: hypothetical protein [Winogradskyella]QXP79813.1 hypothetical protein H0I32_04000 [Winogradskyella sp. HaHa_3_26]
MTILDRYKTTTPKFFRTLRNIGIALATAGGAIIAAPISLPALVVTVATYMTVAGTVATAVSQAVIMDDDADADAATVIPKSPTTKKPNKDPKDSASSSG